MSDRRLISVTSFLVITLILGACMNREFRAYQKSLRDGRYDSEFPSRNASPEIGAIAQSVKKIYSVSYYTTWQFNRDSRVLNHHLRSGTFARMPVGTISTQETVFGTATVITAATGKVAVLTCAHVVASPDTLVSWYDPSGEDADACHQKHFH